jgi:hypothetical protein
VLALSTAVLLAVWLRLVLVGQRLSLPMTIAGFWWPWFFPLWFFLARPAIGAKNPYWRWMSGGGFASGEVRTASLVNRERTSPVTHAMWAVPVLRFVLLLAAVAARGLMLFGAGPLGDAVDPEAARAIIAENEADRTSQRMTSAEGVDVDRGVEGRRGWPIRQVVHPSPDQASVGRLASRARRVQAVNRALWERAGLLAVDGGGRGVCSAGQGQQELDWRAVHGTCRAVLGTCRAAVRQSGFAAETSSITTRTSACRSIAKGSSMDSSRSRVPV